jgi:hypothetical protein
VSQSFVADVGAHVLAASTGALRHPGTDHRNRRHAAAPGGGSRATAARAEETSEKSTLAEP